MNRQFKDEDMKMVYHMEGWLKKWKLKQKWEISCYSPSAWHKLQWLVIFHVGEHMGEKDSHSLLVSMQIGSAFVRAIWHILLLSQISVASLTYNLLMQTASIPAFISYFCVCFLLDGDSCASHLSLVAWPWLLNSVIPPQLQVILIQNFEFT